MDVQRSSVLRESSVWMYQHLVWEQCVEIVLMATLEMERSALVQRQVLCFSNSFSVTFPPTDINECTMNLTLCGQICNNTIGSYECKCEDGYKLMPGTKQCTGTVSYYSIMSP